MIREYYVDNKLHKEDGPAYILFDGSQRWYLNGEWIINSREFCERVNMNDEDTVIFLLKYGESLLDEKLSLFDYERWHIRHLLDGDKIQEETDTEILEYMKNVFHEQFDQYSKDSGYFKENGDIVFNDVDVDIEAEFYAKKI